MYRTFKRKAETSFQFIFICRGAYMRIKLNGNILQCTTADYRQKRAISHTQLHLAEAPVPASVVLIGADVCSRSTPAQLCCISLLVAEARPPASTWFHGRQKWSPRPCDFTIFFSSCILYWNLVLCYAGSSDLGHKFQTSSHSAGRVLIFHL